MPFRGATARLLSFAAVVHLLVQEDLERIHWGLINHRPAGAPRHTRVASCSRRSGRADARECPSEPPGSCLPCRAKSSMGRGQTPRSAQQVTTTDSLGPPRGFDAATQFGFRRARTVHSASPHPATLDVLVVRVFARVRTFMGPGQGNFRPRQRPFQGAFACGASHVTIGVPTNWSRNGWTC